MTRSRNHSFLSVGYWGIFERTKLSQKSKTSANWTLTLWLARTFAVIANNPTLAKISEFQIFSLILRPKGQSASRIFGTLSDHNAVEWIFYFFLQVRLPALSVPWSLLNSFILRTAVLIPYFDLNFFETQLVGNFVTSWSANVFRSAIFWLQNLGLLTCERCASATFPAGVAAFSWNCKLGVVNEMSARCPYINARRKTQIKKISVNKSLTTFWWKNKYFGELHKNHNFKLGDNKRSKKVYYFRCCGL